MTSLCITVCVMLWLPSSNGMTSPSLYAPSQPAAPGSPFTLVCTWYEDGNIENSPSNPTNITWNRGVDLVYIFSSVMCGVEDGRNINVSAKFGLVYQSLTFTSITESDIKDMWYCSLPSYNLSNPVDITSRSNGNVYEVRMSSQDDVVYTGSNITLTCTVVNGSFSRATWIVNNVAYLLGENCTLRLLKESATDKGSIMNRSQTDCSQNSSQTLTITNASLHDHNASWTCSVWRNVSNVLRIIVLDPPDLLDNVSISSSQNTDLGDISLVCSVRCEGWYKFEWNFHTEGYLSNITHDSCDHMCSQTLITHIEERDNGTLITCTVINPRTGKNTRAQYHVIIPVADHTSNGTTPAVSDMSHTLSPYVWVGVAGGVAVIIIVVVVVAIVCRNRSSSSREIVTFSKKPSKLSKGVMENNVLYEPADGNKIVMEPNILYESGAPGFLSQEVDQGDKLEMQENTLGVMICVRTSILP